MDWGNWLDFRRIIPILFLFVLCFFGVFLLWCRSCRKNMHLFTNESKKDVNHAAIVLMRKKEELDKLIRFGEGSFTLAKHFMKIKRPFRVYYWPDASQLHDIIHNHHVKWLYIFGHGRRNAARTSVNEFYPYPFAKNAPRKKYVGLYTCGRGKGSSLVELIAEDGFFRERLALAFENIFEIRKYIKNRKL